MKNFLLARWRGGCTASRIAGQTRHPRDPGANEDERASQRPFDGNDRFDGNPHTRLAGANHGWCFIWDKDVFVSRPAAAIARPAGVSCSHSGRKRSRVISWLPAEDGPASIESSWSAFLRDYPLFDGPSSSPGSVWRGILSAGPPRSAAARSGDGSTPAGCWRRIWRLTTACRQNCSWESARAVRGSSLAIVASPRPRRPSASRSKTFPPFALSAHGCRSETTASTVKISIAFIREATIPCPGAQPKTGRVWIFAADRHHGG